MECINCESFIFVICDLQKISCNKNPLYGDVYNMYRVPDMLALVTSTSVISCYY